MCVGSFHSLGHLVALVATSSHFTDEESETQVGQLPAQDWQSWVQGQIHL